MKDHNAATAAKDSPMDNEPFPWHLGVYDAHCHPTDTVPSIDRIASMKTRALTIMATRGQDQSIVADFTDRLNINSDSLDLLKTMDTGSKSQAFVVPCFGWHPWFSHQIFDDLGSNETMEKQADKSLHYRRIITPPPPQDHDFIASLPAPRPLSTLLDEIRSYLDRYPFALVGEIGLDRSFRIPESAMANDSHERDPALTPGGRDGRRLSPYRVDIDHQKRILTAQLNLAGELQRAVSVHGVAAHGIVFETLRATWHGHEKPVVSKRQKKRRASVDAAHVDDDYSENQHVDDPGPKSFPPRICLHSYSGPVDTLRQYLHPSTPSFIFFSFSRLVNFSSSVSNKAVDVIKAIPDDRILAESDLHAAGDEMDDLMEEIVRTICHTKGWSLDYGVRQLASNWMHFVFGKS